MKESPDRLTALPSLDKIAEDKTLLLRLPAELLLQVISVAAEIAAAGQAALTVVNRDGASTSGRSQPHLLDAKAMADRLGVKENWVRSEARAGKIPSVMVGKYRRYDPVQVEEAVARRNEP